MADTRRTAAVDEFCAITGQGEDVAHRYLIDVGYKLEEAVVNYYSEVDDAELPETIISEVLFCEGPDDLKPVQRPQKIISNAKDRSETSSSSKKTVTLEAEESELTDESKNEDKATLGKRHVDNAFDEARPPKRIQIGHLLEPTPSTSAEQKPKEPVLIDVTPSLPVQTEQSVIPPQLTILSYNIDGLDERIIEKRLVAAMYSVARVNPEVIFFQGLHSLHNLKPFEARISNWFILEVVDRHMEKIHAILGKHYNVFTGEGTGAFRVPYYTVTAVSKNIKIIKSELINYQCTQMGRNMLCVEAKWNALDIRLINSHLESCWDQTSVRKRQFVQAMKKLGEYSADPSVLSIFGGDLNLRDTEVSDVPDGVRDAWIATGSNPEFKYTWDTKTNDNAVTKRPCRNRFDRFYVRGPYKTMNFWLEGRERIKDSLFPSDHFAIVCRFTNPA